MKRNGLSYLEVLIAAGIALTGILGAVALYPVAIMNLRKGQTVDVMAAIGPSVLETASVLHVDDANYWLFRMPAGLVEVERADYPLRPDIDGTQRAFAPDSSEGRRWHPAINPVDSFCIDPRFVAQVATWDASQNDPTMFPAILPAGPLDARMRRVTLAGQSTGIPKPPMSVAQSRLLFKSQDDLLFERPDDKTSPARQLAVNNGADQRRDYFADFEFIYTLSPVTRLSEPPATIVGYEIDPNTGQPYNPKRPIYAPYSYNPAAVTFKSTGEFDVAAVVFRERTPDLSEIVTVGSDPKFIEEERLCDLVFLTPGYGGGDVTATLRPGRPLSDLNVAQSGWVLVSGIESVTYRPSNPALSPAIVGRPVFRWYRVVGFSDIYGSSRDLTLDGPDWPANTSNIRITFCSGVVGVFTKRMQLQ